MLGLLYFGRLEKEKGFDAIIEMILKFGKERHNESSKGTESFHCVELIAYQPNDIRVGNYTSFNQKQKDIFEGGCIPTILDDTISNKVKKLDTSKTARCKDAEELPFQLFIFGEGTYEKAIQELAHKYKTIHYFGWQNLETIRRYTSNCNFILFPSTCLESFGLTALTGIARGLPVIGYAKGGAKPFIEPDLDLDTINGQNLPDKLYHLIHLLNKEDVFVNSLPTTEIVKEYSKENRQAAIAYHLGEKKRILIVSDFRNRIGGVETFINDTKDILNNMGYEAEVRGVKIPKGTRGTLRKYFGFVTGIFNVIGAIRLRWKIKRFKPDVIRYNSVLRHIGRLPMRVSKASKAEKRMMYHDLGYFYPYPSRLENESQIRYPFTMKNFIGSAKTRNPVKIAAIRWKYQVVKSIKTQLQKGFKLHLVPSSFMKPIVQQSYGIPDEQIVVFPHFIQE